ncbi:hypothetical protein KEM54_006295 [Ascosphaera aggregata]|nr:hypothetical protein KEM54_006295 [Ascosphaera aggregata]
MDRKARLNLLLGDANSELLCLDTGRQSKLPKNVQTIPEKTCIGDQTTQVTADTAYTSDIDDEYIQSVGRVSIPTEYRRSRRVTKALGGGVVQEPADVSLKEMIQQDLEFGDFCPLLAVAKFPYKYVHDRTADRIAKAHFDQGKFWSRTWDLYYVHPPTTVSENPILFVPLRQVESFFDQINKSLGHDEIVSIPDDDQIGFITHFKPDGSPLPKFLGVSRSRYEKDDLVDRILPAEENLDEPPIGCTLDAFAAFTSKLERAFGAGRNKKRGNGAKGIKHTEDQRARLRIWVDSLRRTQEYLGLRPPRSDNPSSYLDYSQPWENQQSDAIAWNIAVGNILPPLDTSQPPQYQMTKQPIFICVDVESNEVQHSQITEIGVSTLDTTDLIGLAPGDYGCNWISKIRTRHFRIAEYTHIVNSRYMEGCPEDFQFGKSEIVPLSKIVEVVEACFRPPYSASVTAQQDAVISERNLIFVGHEAMMDIQYLWSLGCTKLFAARTLSRRKNVIETKLSDIFIDQLDTNVLYRALKREFNGTSLANAVSQLGMKPWYLHNAGNDAQYTMQALVGLAIESRVQRSKLRNGAEQSRGALFYPLTCGVSSPLGKQSLDEGLALAIDCEKTWADEVQRRMKEAGNGVAAARVAAQCANWDAALVDSIFGEQPTSRKTGQRW